jgi:outer membrane protein TolC
MAVGGLIMALAVDSINEMILWHPKLLIVAVICVGLFFGCRGTPVRPDANSVSESVTFSEATDSITAGTVAAEIGSGAWVDPATTAGPRTVKDMTGIERWELTLEEAIRLSLANSTVLRDLGGTVVKSPFGVQTALDPAIRETDPRLGVEAALSAFDAQARSTLNSERIDRRLNNRFVGDLGLLSGQVNSWDVGVSKRTATGGRFALNQHIDNERDNNLGNEFPGGAWNVWYEAEARQALLQGGGVNFNRISGPDATPGVYNGIMVARIRADVSLVEFEIGLRDFVSNVENAYWDLYFSYRDLDAKVRARDAALETWRQIEALNLAGRRGGEAEKEAQAREQYFRFEAEAQDSLAGRPLDGTRTNNGSLPGTFRGLPGVLANEKRLRLIMNQPPDPTRLICPIDEPTSAAVIFDWPSATTEALTRRGELRLQRLVVSKNELELLAAKNFLLPQLDVLGRYRLRGFGDSLFESRGALPQGDSAFGELGGGDFAEWQAGLEYTAPVGFRQAYAAVRNAELKLTRERAILRSQQEEIVYGLSQAIAELDRAYVLKQANYNRYLAASQQVTAVEAAYEDDRVEFIAVLDARRRLSDAESQHYRSQTEYAIALKNVHFEKGTLLDYDRIASAEGPWAGRVSRRELRTR